MNQLLRKQIEQTFGSEKAIPSAVRPFVTLVEDVYNEYVIPSTKAIRGEFDESYKVRLVEKLVSQSIKVANIQRPKSGNYFSELAATLSAILEKYETLLGKTSKQDARFKLLYELSVQSVHDSSKSIMYALEKTTQFLRMGAGLICKNNFGKWETEYLYSQPAKRSKGPSKVEIFKYCETISKTDKIYLSYVANRSAKDILKKSDLPNMVGTKIMIEKQLYGVVFFTNLDTSNVSLYELDLEFVELLARWLASAIMMREVKANVERLATFPEQNPYPVIEYDKEVIYSNEAAKRFFPSLGSEKTQHPFLRDIEIISRVLNGMKGGYIVRKINVGNRIFQQTIIYNKITNTLNIFGVEITNQTKAENALRKRTNELERINKLMIGRELKMIHLKRHFEKLAKLA